MFSIIAAIGKNNELGRGNGLVFRIKDDMRFFKETTMGHAVVMGHRTWDSLPGKLPGRRNVVVSRGAVPGADEVVHDLPGFIAAHEGTTEEILVIGGAMVYNEFLKHAKCIYLTEVDAAVEDADSFFPAFDRTLYDREIIRKGSENGLDYAIMKYTKNN